MPRLCLSKFICTKSKKVNNDYECLPYEKESPRVVLPTTVVRQQIINNLMKLNKLNTLKKNVAKKNLFADCVQNEAPNFHSTQLDQSSVNFAACFKNIEDSKVTSTVLQESDITDYSSFNSPELSNISEESSAFTNPEYSSPFTNSSVFTDDSVYQSFGSSQYLCASQTSGDFQSVNPSFFDKDNSAPVVHVCCRSYKAKFDGDIDLEFTERVQILHTNDEFSLVKKITTNECGYVPTECLILFSEFIKNI